MGVSTPPLEIVSASYDGYVRVLFLRCCALPSCHKHFYAPKHIAKRYCCTSCSSQASRSRVPVICSWCGVNFEITPGKVRRSRKGLFFCTRQCKDTAQRLDGLKALHPPQYNAGYHIEYRKWAFRIYGPQCCKCGYSNDLRMLDVDHIDSNRKNNSVNNWQVLCVWCHALKTRGVSEHPRQ